MAFEVFNTSESKGTDSGEFSLNICKSIGVDDGVRRHGSTRRRRDKAAGRGFVSSGVFTGEGRDRVRDAEEETTLRALETFDVLDTSEGRDRVRDAEEETTLRAFKTFDVFDTSEGRDRVRNAEEETTLRASMYSILAKARTALDVGIRFDARSIQDLRCIQYKRRQ